jgi:hypothetical protein
MIQSHSGRAALLTSLLNSRSDLDELLDKLAMYSFDSDSLVEINRNHIDSLLSDYIDGLVGEEFVEKWANAIEVRDDLDYAKNHKEALVSAVHDLANPTLSGRLTTRSAMALRDRIAANP